MLLSYKPLHLEAQQRLQEEGCVVDIRYIYLMKHKSETFEKFKEFQSEVENHRNKKIKFLRSDRGDEYLSYEFGLHLKQCGIVS